MQRKTEPRYLNVQNRPIFLIYSNICTRDMHKAGGGICPQGLT